METNREGMTWEEWAYAAGVEPSHVGTVEIGGYCYPVSFVSKERKAWEAGEDPTEWRAGS